LDVAGSHQMSQRIESAASRARRTSVLFKQTGIPLRVKGEDRVRVVPIAPLHSRRSDGHARDSEPCYGRSISQQAKDVGRRHVPLNRVTAETRCVARGQAVGHVKPGANQLQMLVRNHVDFQTVLAQVCDPQIAAIALRASKHEYVRGLLQYQVPGNRAERCDRQECDDPLYRPDYRVLSPSRRTACLRHVTSPPITMHLLHA
jgi:hypothetical protein